MRIMIALAAAAAAIAVPASASSYFGFGYSDFQYHSLTINGTGSISSSNAGWFDANGDHAGYNQNYIVANFNGFELRNFFVFDSGGAATSLTLNIANPYVWDFGGNPKLTYTLYDATNTIDTFQDYSGATGIFNDLGTGTVYGSVTYSSTPGSVSITLNQAAIDAYNAAGDAGQAFAIGGRITAGAVPEPASWAMLIAGFGLVGAVARRRRGLIKVAG